MIKLTKKSIALLLKQRFAEEDISLKDLPNPSLLLDGVKGAKRVAKAILNKEKITIVGDYDVDGVVSTTILSEFLRKLPTLLILLFQIVLLMVMESALKY